jgi:hypothetical protein
MGAYLIIIKGKTGEEAWSYFRNISPPFKPFRDAIRGSCSYDCTVYNIIRN